MWHWLTWGEKGIDCDWKWYAFHLHDGAHFHGQNFSIGEWSNKEWKLSDPKNIISAGIEMNGHLLKDEWKIEDKEKQREYEKYPDLFWKEGIKQNNKQYKVIYFPLLPIIVISSVEKNWFIERWGNVNSNTSQMMKIIFEHRMRSTKTS